MSRPLSQGESAINRDIQSLMKIKDRATLDPKRSEADRRELNTILKRAITILLNGKRDALNAKPRKTSNKSAAQP